MHTSLAFGWPGRFEIGPGTWIVRGPMIPRPLRENGEFTIFDREA